MNKINIFFNTLFNLFRSTAHCEALQKFNDLCEYAKKLSATADLAGATYSFLADQKIDVSISKDTPSYKRDYYVKIITGQELCNYKGVSGLATYCYIQLKINYPFVLNKPWLKKSKKFLLKWEANC